MLPLVSNTIPMESGASSLPKETIFCLILSSIYFERILFEPGYKAVQRIGNGYRHQHDVDVSADIGLRQRPAFFCRLGARNDTGRGIARRRTGSPQGLTASGFGSARFRARHPAQGDPGDRPRTPPLPPLPQNRRCIGTASCAFPFWMEHSTARTSPMCQIRRWGRRVHVN